MSDHATDRPRFVYVSYIRTTPEKLWQAITEPAFTRRYFHGTEVESDWKPGSSLAFRLATGELMVQGEVVECDRPRRLSYTWSARWDGGVADDAPSRVTWEIKPTGDVCKLTVVHDEFAGETATYKGVSQGWPHILCSLKSLLETGEPLAAAM